MLFTPFLCLKTRSEGAGAEGKRDQNGTDSTRERERERERMRLEKVLSGSLVLHLLEEFVGGILVAVLLHLGQMTLLWRHCCIHLNYTVMN